LTPSETVKVSRSRLRLTAVTPADNGVYSCRARNAAATTHSDTFLLNRPTGNALTADSSTVRSQHSNSTEPQFVNSGVNSRIASRTR